MTISRQAAQTQLDLYIQCERDILTHGQSTRMDDRMRTRADLVEVRNGITYWSAMVERLAGRRRIRIRNIIPTD